MKSDLESRVKQLERNQAKLIYIVSSITQYLQDKNGGKL